MRSLITILILLSTVMRSWSQQAVVDNLIPPGDADLPYEDLYENIAQLTVNRMDLNHVTADALLSLGILTQKQAEAIINYRKTNGDFLEIYELQSVPSLEPETIRSIIPYVTVHAPALKGNSNTYFFTRYERTLETARGYIRGPDSSAKYNGDPGRIYSRFRSTTPGVMSVGITAEKDAGEKFRWTKNQHGFDFYSSHLQLMNRGPVVNAIAGDYVAQFGQGLTLGGGFGMGKGSETITTLRRSSTGFMPYSSANEAGFFRGGAISIALPSNFVAHAFASSLQRDASNSEEGSLAVLQSGKHRTDTEIAGRHQLTEKNYGASIEYKGRSLDAGVVLHRTLFPHPINKSPTVYNSFDFSGTSNMNTGVFANYNLQNFSLFGELSQTIGNGRGWICGILGSISRNIDVSLLARRFDRNFYTFYSNAISESTTPKNEAGIYWGWKHAINRKLFYTAYVDLFTFPWLRFRDYIPSAGNESLVRLTYKRSKNFDLFIQFRDERKSRNITMELPTYQAAMATRQNWIIGSSMNFGKLSLKTRIQLSSFRQLKTSHGFAMAFDAAYDWNRFSIATRFAVFDTDNFDNRQYMNERDVLMSFSFPAYYGEGTRTYAVIRYQPVRWLDFWLKLAETNYFNSVTSGSGYDTINSNKRHDVKVELVFRPG
ncbi:MAG: helix-hairpin-helix domain-containing protein [Bacteroidota bacterium]